MNSKKNLLLSLMILCLIGCNSLGTKEELVARIGSEKIYLSDVELSQKLANTEKRSTRFADVFNEIILNEGMAILARSTYPGITSVVNEDVKRMDNRLLTMVYQQYHILEMLGFTQSEVEKYYKANKDSFPMDSTQTFNDIRKNVAQKLFIKTNADSLKRFIDAMLPSYDQPAEVDLYFFKSQTKKELTKLEADLAKKSLDSIEGVNRLNLNEKIFHELLAINELKPFIFGDSALPVNASPKTVVVGDTLFYTLQVISRKEYKAAVIEDHLADLEFQFIEVYKRDMVRESYRRLEEKYNIEKQPISEAEAKKYYDAHADEFKTIPGYSVYHIEQSDSTLLQKEVLDQVFSLADFKKKASELTQNTFTKEQEGLVGHIKKGHSLPYGIGIIPQLFEEFAGKPEGTISSIIKAPKTDKYHVFYLEKEIAAEQKTFDRVRSTILSQLANDETIQLDSSFVLVTSHGKPIVRERDLRALLNEIPEAQRAAFSRVRLIDFLTQWAVYAMEAKSFGLEQSWEYKAFVRQTRRDLTNQYYRDSLKLKKEFSEEELKSVYDRFGTIISPNASFEGQMPLLKMYLKTPENVLKREYYYNEEAYRSFADFEAARGMVFRNISSIEDKNQWKRLEKDMWSKYKVTVFSTKMPSLRPILSLDSLFSEAAKYYSDRKLNEARTDYELIRSLYPENETAYKKATFEIATIDNENESYNNAESEYRVYYKLWPNDPDSEKAMFSRAFILSENLKQDSLALPLFKDFIVKYPKSELKESVEWLIKNIESNGKLAQELVEKISKTEETDSQGSISNEKAE